MDAPKSYKALLKLALSNSTYFFPYIGNLKGWKILLQKNLLHAIPSSNGTRENREKSYFCYPFILRQLYAVSCQHKPYGTLNINRRCINPNLSLKLALLSIFMHNGWFSMLGAMNSLSIYCRATTMMLMRASFCNLPKVFSILRYTSTYHWSVNQVAGINNQENSNKLKINQSQ